MIQEPPTQPFQSINTRDNTFAPEAPSFTYIPPPTSQQLPKYTQNLNYQSQENNNNIKELPLNLCNLQNIILIEYNNNSIKQIPLPVQQWIDNINILYII